MSAEDLLQDEFIMSNVEHKEVRNEVLLDIGYNLSQFRCNTAFQAGVMTFIVS